MANRNEKTLQCLDVTCSRLSVNVQVFSWDNNAIGSTAPYERNALDIVIVILLTPAASSVLSEACWLRVGSCLEDERPAFFDRLAGSAGRRSALLRWGAGSTTLAAGFKKLNTRGDC